MSDLNALPLILLLLSVFNFVALPVSNAVSRHAEAAADRYALEMLGTADGAVTMHQKLAVAALSDVNPPLLVQWLRSTHPSDMARIVQAERYAAAHGGECAVTGAKETHGFPISGDAGAGPVLRLYLLNGVRSAPHFLDRLKETLCERLTALGCEVQGRVLFPYDDWHRRLLPQIREARHDIMLPYRRYERSVGGRRVLAELESDCAENAFPRAQRNAVEDRIGRAKVMESKEAIVAMESKPLVRRKGLALFIGHSAGGVAAVHAAGLLLAREGGMPCPVVMIGSPKCRIPGPLRDAVLYVQAERKREARGAARDAERRLKTAAWEQPSALAAGKAADLICRIGSFGGWGKDAGRLLPGWQDDRHAPGARAAVQIAGGHADYFRDRPPYIADDGRTNMDETLAAVWPWLTARLAERLR
ncbi:M48 family metalloprotease [Cohnella ginsengisoli]|uniref:M48 family metalloprotease n=1 Tax=Cohnella ginsengisoli TaxID=425004 RepID=A0A9X4KJH0_9BACL|nr:M48 family metalloprotease [Cohnella ginsengisoli]MDG0793061.1 M48 family metalloprotease [Cohnella ginsengisoli]